MAQPAEVLRTAVEEVSTSSTKKRIRIFRDFLPPLLHSSELSSDVASQLVDVIFKTLLIYDDRASRKAVDDLIVKALSESIFMKCFAATLVQSMEKHVRTPSPVGSYKLLKWSCLLLRWSQFSAVSKGGFLRLATAQAFLCQLLMQGSFRTRRSCKKMFFQLFSAESHNIYKLYIEELKESKISSKDSAALIRLLLDFSISNSSLFEQYKPIFLELYVKVVLNTKDKPSHALGEAFQPLFMCMDHEDFKSLVVPSSVKMLKRNPEIVLESIGDLLKLVKLDLSKYVVEFLSVILPQARHADEERRSRALAILGCLSQMSSDPDTLPAMFSAIKAIIGGSEGKLALPYQRVGMVNALQELSKAPGGKQLNKLAPSVTSCLLSCYKDDGSEEVKLAILSALASWASRSPEAVQPDVITFVAAGLREKEVLRKGHLRLLRVICKNSDSLIRVLPLLDPLIQLVKTGFTKATQRLDGIYALFSVAKMASIDTKAAETLQKEKIWSLVALNESSLVSIPLLTKLSNEDCIMCVELLEVLLVEHQHRTLESLSVRSLLQLLLYLVCHPSWDVRKAAYDVTRKITSSSLDFTEDLLHEFTSWLSSIGDKLSRLNMSDTESALDYQMPFIPSNELLVKALLLIAPAALAKSPETSSRLIFCSHHPCTASAGRSNSVWKRFQRSLRTHGFDIVDIIAKNVGSICKDLLGPMGLMSSDSFEQLAAVSSLSALMTITPNDTFLEFVKIFKELPDRSLHDSLSKKDIKIFYTPEGQVSSEQGVYVAETVSGKSAVPARREPGGKKENGKTTKKNAHVDKPKTAKEEARELLLKEEASTRERVRCIQKKLNLMLNALGEIAIANPVFTHGQLPSLFTEKDTYTKEEVDMVRAEWAELVNGYFQDEP